MVCRRLADLVVVLHVLIVLFLFYGPFMSMKDAWVALFHIPLAVWVTVALIMNLTCPLTPLENYLRKAAGVQGYEGSFVDHYLGALVPGNPPATNPNSQSGGRKSKILLAIFVGVWALALHGWNVVLYHDTIWPPHELPPIASPDK